MRILENDSQESQEVYAIYWFDWKKYFYCLPDGHNGFMAIREDECIIVDPTISEFILTKGDSERDVFVHWAAHKGGLMYDLVDGSPDVAKEFKRRLKEDSFEDYKASLMNKEVYFQEEVVSTIDALIGDVKNHDTVDLNEAEQALLAMKSYIDNNKYNELYLSLPAMEYLYILLSKVYKEGQIYIEGNEDDYPYLFLWSEDKQKRVELNTVFDENKKKLYGSLSLLIKVLSD